ncbi:MAG TPA: GntP family permease [Rhodothermales bacterium]|nr:GntP family permease [Rhodothermales bacterium]
MLSGPILLVLLLIAIVFIVVATARFKVNAFLVLLAAAYALGLAAGLPGEEMIQALTGGFAATVGQIGIVIAAGTVIGIVLERCGGAAVMAGAITRFVGEKRSSFAMSITGAVVSIPVFCDSGFVILSPLAKSLAQKSRHTPAVFATALSMGLYTTHVFVPPTPGPIAAAGVLGAGIGTVVVLGLIVSVPVVLATYAFAVFMGSRVHIEPPETVVTEEAAAESATPAALRHPFWAFVPILAPVLLIALRSVAELPSRPFGSGALAAVLSFLGNPNTALLLGVGLAFVAARRSGPRVYGPWVSDALASAGGIILITGAGGALGGVLRATPIADYLSHALSAMDFGAFGLLLPFIIAAALKTALGSSTVALITTAPLVAPTLDALGLGSPVGLALTVLAIAAGSMVVSHANDSYFWVVSQFSGMTVSQAYRLQTLGSAVAGVTGIVFVLVLRAVLL